MRINVNKVDPIVLASLCGYLVSLAKLLVKMQEEIDELKNRLT